MNEELVIKLNEAWKLRGAGEYDKARALVEEVESEANETDFLVLGRVFHIYAQFNSDHEEYEVALENYKTSLEFYQKSGNIFRIAHSTRHIADILNSMNQLQESIGYYRKALKIYREHDVVSKIDLANALLGYGQAQCDDHQFEEARASWKEAIAIYEELKVYAGLEDIKKRLSKLP